MAYSIQLYQFNTSKNISEIKRICENAIQTKIFPQIISVSPDTEYVQGKLKIMKGEEVLFYEFIIQPKRNLLILGGRGSGRNDVNMYLSELIENESRYEIVSGYQLKVKDMLNIFKKITKEHDCNIMLNLKLIFDPTIGTEYAKETYTELSYKFVDNRCASKHADFDVLCDKSKRMYMTVGLVKCVGLVEDEQTDHFKIEIKPECTFRAYKDIHPENWAKFCFKILNFSLNAV